MRIGPETSPYRKYRSGPSSRTSMSGTLLEMISDSTLAEPQAMNDLRPGCLGRRFSLRRGGRGSWRRCGGLRCRRHLRRRDHRLFGLAERLFAQRDRAGDAERGQHDQRRGDSTGAQPARRGARPDSLSERAFYVLADVSQAASPGA